MMPSKDSRPRRGGDRMLGETAACRQCVELGALVMPEGLPFRGKVSDRLSVSVQFWVITDNAGSKP